ncbi:Potassium transporter 13 [Camellia lanceoleosa]|nr:Potassium transporter 13 [Camellia lanceoleosa]
MGIALGVYIAAEYFLQAAMLHALVVITMVSYIFVVFTHFPSASSTKILPWVFALLVALFPVTYLLEGQMRIKSILGDGEAGDAGEKDKKLTMLLAIEGARTSLLGLYAAIFMLIALEIKFELASLMREKAFERGGIRLTLPLYLQIKYVLIVLWANDDGEGGTFALYSLICRHAKVSLLPNQLPSDAHISSFRLKVPSPELERSLKIKERLETSSTLKKLLLMLVLAGTSMVIADGVVTPAMSVMSAVGGLKVGVSWINQDEVVMISVAFLVILFSVQSSVLKAFNPVHIYYFFQEELN